MSERERERERGAERDKGSEGSDAFHMLLAAQTQQPFNVRRSEKTGEVSAGVQPKLCTGGGALGGVGRG